MENYEYFMELFGCLLCSCDPERLLSLTFTVLQLLSKFLDDFLVIKDWHLNFLLHGFNLQLVWLEEACNHKLHSLQ